MVFIFQANNGLDGYRSLSISAAYMVNFTASPIRSIFGFLPESHMLSRTRFKNPSPRASMKLVPVTGLGKSLMKPASS
jgi:hypothetical protein